jgi:AraC family transcriptional regulator
MCGGWFPESGYQPGDGVCFESYLNNPEEHPEGKHIVEICIPVKPL